MCADLRLFSCIRAFYGWGKKISDEKVKLPICLPKLFSLFFFSCPGLQLFFKGMEIGGRSERKKDRSHHVVNFFFATCRFGWLENCGENLCGLHGKTSNFKVYGALIDSFLESVRVQCAVAHQREHYIIPAVCNAAKPKERVHPNPNSPLLLHRSRQLHKWTDRPTAM